MKTRALITSLFSFLLLMSFVSGPKGETEFYKGSYDDLLRQAKKENKAVILDFWASWCGPCKKMDLETFSNPDLGLFINKNFLIYKVDIDSFDGIEISDRYGVESFPTLLVLDPNARPVETLKGYYAPHYLEKELKTLGEREGLIKQANEVAFNK